MLFYPKSTEKWRVELKVNTKWYKEVLLVGRKVWLVFAHRA